MTNATTPTTARQPTGTSDVMTAARRYKAALDARVKLFRTLAAADPYPQLPGETGREAEQRMYDDLGHDRINSEFFDAEAALIAAMESPGARPGSGRACVVDGLLFYTTQSVNDLGEEFEGSPGVEIVRMADVAGLDIAAR